jgi:nudix-type nucleoside diphosphatase (YffH/AdpP family)
MTDTASIRIRSTLTQLKDWATVQKVTYDHRRSSGEERTHAHTVIDVGDAAAVLPYDPDRRTVLLVRQFRLPVHLTAGDGLLLEACAGKLDGDDPETCIRREAMEELGCRLTQIERLFEAYMSPGALTERCTFFLAPYGAADRIGPGGGEADEGEDIEVVEAPFPVVLAMLDKGEIRDAKTIILLQSLERSGRLA